MRKAERESGNSAAADGRALQLADDDRAWLADRLEEYKDLLVRLREH